MQKIFLILLLISSNLVFCAAHEPQEKSWINDNADYKKLVELLFDASKKGYIKTIKCILESGKVHVDVRESNIGATPLMMSACSPFMDDEKRFEVIETLLKAGANIDAKNNDGCTALFSCLSPAVIRKLIEYDANVNARDNLGLTVLMHHCISGCVENVRTLIENGADITATLLNSKKTAMFYTRNAEIAKMLIVPGMVDVRDENEMTALIEACKNDCTDMVEVLIEAGACVNVIDERGYSPLDYALENKNYIEMRQKKYGILTNQQIIDYNHNKEIIEILKKHGAE